MHGHLRVVAVAEPKVHALRSGVWTTPEAALRSSTYCQSGHKMVQAFHLLPFPAEAVCDRKWSLVECYIRFIAFSCKWDVEMQRFRAKTSPCKWSLSYFYMGITSPGNCQDITKVLTISKECTPNKKFDKTCLVARRFHSNGWLWLGLECVRLPIKSIWTYTCALRRMACNLKLHNIGPE